MFSKREKKTKQPYRAANIDGIISRRKINTNQKSKNKKILSVFLILLVFILVLTFILLINIGKCAQFFNLLNIYKNGTHLILFQNNAELRPTGGFIGSFATFKTHYFIPGDFYYDANIYKRDNEFTYKTQIKPNDTILANFVPEGNLAMRDSNWSIDFTQAAPEVAWFYEQEGGEKIDSVTAIDSEFFKNLLKIIGPIKMVKYNLVVDQNNFNQVIEDYVETEYYKNKDNYSIGEPKTILSEMIPVVISRIKQIKNWPALYQLLFNSLEKKDVIIYSFIPKIQKDISKNNWSDEVIQRNSDYLYLNHANLGSNKTSSNMRENITYSVAKEKNALIANLEIVRYNPDNDKPNKNFSSILVPAGSQLISSTINEQPIDDIELIEKYNKTIWRLWTLVDPSQTTVAKLKYQLPDNINFDNYSLYVQKQPGAVNQNIEINIAEKIKFDDKLEKDLIVK